MLDPLSLNPYSKPLEGYGSLIQKPLSLPRLARAEDFVLGAGNFAVAPRRRNSTYRRVPLKGSGLETLRVPLKGSGLGFRG